MTIVVSMGEPQYRFFTDSVALPFAAANSIDVALSNITDIDAIVDRVAASRDVGLFMVPFGKAWSAVDRKMVRPISSFLSEKEYGLFTGEYILTWLGKRDDVQYFMPDKYETRILAYRKSKVADAVERWSDNDTVAAALRDSINELVRRVNGRGLPEGYFFEADPSSWDFFDVFVAGAVWASMSGNNGAGRLGHRSKRYSGTALRIIDRVVQCGGDSSNIMMMNGNPVIDAFLWESMYAALGLCHREMFTAEWSGREVCRALLGGTIYLSFVTQVDCFSIKRTGSGELAGDPAVREDIDFSTMPRGCSVELDEQKHVKRTGTGAVTTGGWWWAIPAVWSDPKLSYRLFRAITSKDNQLRECTKYGMIPVRTDVLKDQNMLSGSGWIPEMFRVSYAQVRINDAMVVPADGVFDRISGLYLDAWKSLVFDGGKPLPRRVVPDRPAIARTLAETYAPRAGQIKRQAGKQ